MIYKYCLFVGKVAPYSGSKAKALLPYVPLLCLCQAVHLEAEPIAYENTFIFSSGKAIQKLFDRTHQTPERKLLLKSVEISLQVQDRSKGALEALAYYFSQPSRRANTQGAETSSLSIHYWMKATQRNKIWPRQVLPILDYLTLDRLVVDLDQSFCLGNCNCKIAAMAVTCFKKGFALRTPKVLKTKGWDAGREDVEAVVQECLRIWTSRRARGMVEFSHSAVPIESEAEEWLLKEAAREEDSE